MPLSGNLPATSFELECGRTSERPLFESALPTSRRQRLEEALTAAAMAKTKADLVETIPAEWLELAERIALIPGGARR